MPIAPATPPGGCATGETRSSCSNADLDVEGLGRAVVAEDATEVVVGSESEAERLHEWLNERGVGHVTVRPV